MVVNAYKGNHDDPRWRLLEKAIDFLTVTDVFVFGLIIFISLLEVSPFKCLISELSLKRDLPIGKNLQSLCRKMSQLVKGNNINTIFCNYFLKMGAKMLATNCVEQQQ